MSDVVQVHCDDEANGDLAEILAQFTNYIMNERVRSYNEGFDAGRKAAHDDDDARGLMP